MERARRAGAEERARQQAAERRRQSDERQRELQAARPATVSTAGLDDLDKWETVFPEARFWSPARGWDWLQPLPPELHRAARAMTYATQELTASSPTATILPQFQGQGDRKRVLDLLEEQGVITRYMAQRAPIERWRRGGPDD